MPALPWKSIAAVTPDTECTHHAGVQATRPHMARSDFVFWTCTAADLPIRFDEVRHRLAAER